jgi:hypothetical protein
VMMMFIGTETLVTQHEQLLSLGNPTQGSYDEMD